MTDEIQTADASPAFEWVPLEGEGNDRAIVTPAGTRFRVRVVVTDRDLAKPAPGVTSVIAAPTKVTLSISLALLDDENRVQTLGGGYRIFDRHELLIADDNLAHEGYDLAALLDQTVARLAADAERVVANHAATAGYLEQAWGLSLARPTGEAA